MLSQTEGFSYSIFILILCRMVNITYFFMRPYLTGRILFISLMLQFLVLTAFSQGYEIKVNIKGVSDTTAILGHYLNNSMYPDDTARLDSKGNGVFKGKKALHQGLYVLFLPDSKYVEFIMGSDQQYTLSTDTVDMVKNLVSEGSPDNEIFFDFQKYMISRHDDLAALQKKYTAATEETEKQNIRSEIEKINTDRKSKINGIIQNNPNLFVSVFVKATLDIDIPSEPVNKKEKADSTWKYRYFRAHYFDNFNYADSRLLYTPMYEEKIMFYLEKVVPPYIDTLNKEIDVLLDNVSSDSIAFRYMLITLFNYYGKSNIMGMDAVQVHLAKKYYIDRSWWNDKKFIDELKERVTILEPLLLGKVAPDIQLRVVPADHFIAAAADTGLKRYPHAGKFVNLHEIDADFLVLIFWEATCGHCQKAVPLMHKIYADTLKAMGVEVIAVSTLFGEDGKEKWIDFVNKNKLYDWINAWNPYDYQFKITYDVKTTPQIFVLNAEREIIGKRIGPENVVDLIKAYKKQYPNK
jgi:thiol-disulfide isomerase/thioredoxin